MFVRPVPTLTERCRLISRNGLSGVDPRSVGGVLGGLFVGVAAVVVAGTVWLLPATVSRGLTWSLCGAGLIGAAAAAMVPWERWRVGWLLVVPVAGQLFLAVSWALVPGTGRHYVGLIVFGYAHAGLTQRRGVSLLLVPFSVLAAVAGGAWSVNAVILIFIGVAVAEALTALSGQQRRTHNGLSALLRAVRHLSAAATVDDAAVTLSTEASTVLGADMALVYTADREHPNMFVNRTVDAAFGPMQVDIDHEASGVGIALRSQQTLFVKDAAGASMISQRLVAATGMNSAMYVPLTGADRPVGVLVVGWRHMRGRFGGDVDKIVDILASEAGRVVERLIRAEALTAQTLTDALTGVGNRRLWEDQLDSLHTGDSVVLIDIDRFKLVNDSHGHDRGDRVLRVIAGCVRTAIREGDVVARIGGDEFGVILRDVAATGADEFADRLLALWEVAVDGVSYSIGHAVHTPGATSQNTIGEADRNLYTAKTSAAVARRHPTG